jgi:Derlin-2/3
MAANNQGGAMRGMDDFDFKSFLTDIPPVTRTLVLSCIICTIGSGFGILPNILFGLYWPAIAGKLQIWRLVLSFFHLGGLGFPFLMSTYFMYHYSRQLESGFFFNRTANYCWFLAFVATFTSIVSFIFPMGAAAPAVLMSILHLWGRHSGNLIVKLYGFISIPAKYFSLATLGLELILTGSMSKVSITGLIAGHAYYFLDSVYPTLPNGRVVIGVPPAFESFVDSACIALASATGIGAVPPPQPTPGRRATSGTTSSIGSIHGGGAGATSSSARTGLTMPNLRPGQYNWGTGHSLGST